MSALPSSRAGNTNPTEGGARSVPVETPLNSCCPGRYWRAALDVLTGQIAQMKYSNCSFDSSDYSSPLTSFVLRSYVSAARITT